jgi:hypothetical protein
MRKQMKRLTLSKETLHSLESRDLSKAAGMTIKDSCSACDASLCGTICTRCVTNCPCP